MKKQIVCPGNTGTKKAVLKLSEFLDDVKIVDLHKETFKIFGERLNKYV